jgi:hypothetical protein
MLSDIILSVIVVNVILLIIFILNFIMLSVTPLTMGGGRVMLTHRPPPLTYWATLLEVTEKGLLDI